MAEREEHVWGKPDALHEFTEGIARVAGYPLPKDIADIFTKPYLACYLAYKNPDIAPQEKPETWRQLAEHIDEVDQSVSAMHYHLENVNRIEGEVDLLVEKYQKHTPLEHRGNWVFNVNFTNRLTFEYHAFTFVSVRCLTYLSFAVGRSLRKTCPHLKSLRKVLAGESERGNHGAEELLRVLCNHGPFLSNMFSRMECEKKRYSVRDWIAHEAFLPAGHLNISGEKTELAGVLKASADGMDTDARDNYRLSDVMRSQFRQVETFVREMMVELEKYFLPRIL